MGPGIVHAIMFLIVFFETRVCQEASITGNRLENRSGPKQTIFHHYEKGGESMQRISRILFFVFALLLCATMAATAAPPEKAGYIVVLHDSVESPGNRTLCPS